MGILEFREELKEELFCAGSTSDGKLFIEFVATIRRCSRENQERVRNSSVKLKSSLDIGLHLIDCPVVILEVFVDLVAIDSEEEIVAFGDVQVILLLSITGLDAQ